MVALLMRYMNILIRELERKSVVAEMPRSTQSCHLINHNRRDVFSVRDFNDLKHTSNATPSFSKLFHMVALLMRYMNSLIRELERKSVVAEMPRSTQSCHSLGICSGHIHWHAFNRN